VTSRTPEKLVELPAIQVVLDGRVSFPGVLSPGSSPPPHAASKSTVVRNELVRIHITASLYRQMSPFYFL
jgi:hypothetical protein